MSKTGNRKMQVRTLWGRAVSVTHGQWRHSVMWFLELPTLPACDSNYAWRPCLGDNAKLWGGQLWAPASFEYRNSALVGWFIMLHLWCHQDNALLSSPVIVCTASSSEIYVQPIAHMLQKQYKETVHSYFKMLKKATMVIIPDFVTTYNFTIKFRRWILIILKYKIYLNTSNTNKIWWFHCWVNVQSFNFCDEVLVA